MGLLDDAIREHLELKRRRGGDPVEISRQENEAFAAARRTPAGAPDVPGGEPPPAAAAPPDDVTAVHAAPPAHEVPRYEPPPHVGDPEPVASYEPPLPPPAEHEPWMSEPLDEPEPEPPLPSARRAPADESGSLLSRFRVGRRRREPEPEPEPDFDEPPARYAHQPPPAAYEPEIVPADDEPGGDDLLEETPEFLEETPDHDRLWFEQRPPRDFNFDD